MSLHVHSIDEILFNINPFHFSMAHSVNIFTKKKKKSMCTYWPLSILNLLFIFFSHCATTYIKPWKRRNQIDFIALYVPLCKCMSTTGLKIEPLNCLLRLFSAVHYGIVIQVLNKFFNNLIALSYTMYSIDLCPWVLI